MAPYTEHTQAIDNIHLHYLEWEGANPPVVFIPGFIANAYAALNLGAAISPLRRVLSLNLRGRGGSDKPEGTYGIEQHVQDIQNWLDVLGIDQCILAGHSFGAAVSLFFTLQAPQRVQKIILLDGGSTPSNIAFQLFHDYHSHLTYEYPSVEAYMTPYRQLVTMQPWTEVAEILTRANLIEQADGSAIRSVPRHVVEAELARIDLNHWRSLADFYAQIKVPVLLVRAGWGSFGQEDQHLNQEIVDFMQASFPDLRVFDMPNAGHTSILTVEDAGRDEALRAFVK